MGLNSGRIIRSLALLGLGTALGATGGAMAYRKLHPAFRPRPGMGGAPGSGSLAPPEMSADDDGAGKSKWTDAAAPSGLGKTPLPEDKPPAITAVAPSDAVVAAKPEEVVPAKPAEVVAAKPADVVVAKPADVDVAKPADVVVVKPADVEVAKPADVVVAKPADVEVAKPAEVVEKTADVVPAKSEDVVAAKTPARQEFFGFPVGSADTLPEPESATTFLRLRLMKDRCVGGFDGKSSVLDFSGWTKALTGELTYEKGRLAETAKGFVTADPATLDTGDADRDKEIREKHLETARFTEMRFDVSSLRMTGLDAMDMTGAMEIHGTKKEVTIPCSITMRPDGFVCVKGEIKVNMTDFGIEPPTKAGVIKVENEIRIWFEIWAEPVKEAK